MPRLLCRQGFVEGELGIPARKSSCRLPKGLERLVHQEGFVVSSPIPPRCRIGTNDSLYLPLQETLYRQYFKEWMSDPAPPQVYMMKMRDLNMETSLSVFLGPYVTPAQRLEINERYWLITKALELVNFPLAIPGTKIYNAIQARKLVMKYLMAASAESKRRMADMSREPECLLDEWTRAMVMSRKTGEEGDEQARLLSREYSDKEIGLVLLSFLFASQDAMSSAITFAFQYAADFPDVLAKIREEQYRIRGNDLEAPLTLDMVDDMVYTRAFVKEVMRIRPPVIMVPYKTTKPFPIAKDYTVPKGSMVIPVMWNSLHDEEVFPDPDQLKPERWLKNADGSEPLAESKPQNYLVWGSGPHKVCPFSCFSKKGADKQCIGTQYASMHLAATLGTASVLMDWEHERTPDSDEIQVIAGYVPFIVLFPINANHSVSSPKMV